MSQEHKEHLDKVMEIICEEKPQNTIFMSTEGRTYLKDLIRDLLHQNSKTLSFPLDFGNLTYAATEILRDGEIVIFDSEGKSHGFLLDDYEDKIDPKHIQ